MEYYLTSKLVCPVGHMPFLRKDFEEYLVTWFPLDFPLENFEGSLLIFWNGDMLGMDPAEKIAAYVNTYEEQTAWDAIRNKTAAIVASHRR